MSIFGQLFVEIGSYFSPTSGHAGPYNSKGHFPDQLKASFQNIFRWEAVPVQILRPAVQDKLQQARPRKEMPRPARQGHDPLTPKLQSWLCQPCRQSAGCWARIVYNASRVCRRLVWLPLTFLVVFTFSRKAACSRGKLLRSAEQKCSISSVNGPAYRSNRASMNFIAECFGSRILWRTTVRSRCTCRIHIL